MNLLASILLLASIPVPHVTKGEVKLQSVAFRYENSPLSEDTLGQKFVTVEPYVPFKLGVVQVAGPDHKNHTLVNCTPGSEVSPIVDAKTGERADGPHLILNCDDGTKFVVGTVVFDQR